MSENMFSNQEVKALTRIWQSTVISGTGLSAVAIEDFLFAFLKIIIINASLISPMRQLLLKAP